MGHVTLLEEIIAGLGVLLAFATVALIITAFLLREKASRRNAWDSTPPVPISDDYTPVLTDSDRGDFLTQDDPPSHSH